MIAFGPVPSRRLGRSLGINNIPPKVCTYSCIYCQLGHTIRMQVTRPAFYEPGEVFEAVQNKVQKAQKAGESVDYLTFVPDGEPTLDVNLGREIELLRSLGIKIAVITNSSLIYFLGVRQDLMKADWVSLKLDSTREETWRRLDRP
jgi:wyosine [tRNA(Phe)-imidazoG37] synthetase (radical SAM superfamily)